MADLVGIQNRFEGVWLDGAEPGWGFLRWGGDGAQALLQPVLRVRDKGKLKPGQPVTWVITGDGLVLHVRPAQAPGEFNAEVLQARHPGEITLTALAFDAPGARMQVTLTGAARASLAAGDRVSVVLGQGMVHVMPVRRP